MSRGAGPSSALLEGFGEDVAVAGSEGDSAEGGERGSDIGGSDGLEILAGLNAKAHQQNGNVLIVVVGDTVTGSVGTRFSRGCAVHQPIGLWNDEEVATAAGRLAEGEGADQGALRGGTILQFFCAIDCGDAGMRQSSFNDRLHSCMVVLQFFVKAGDKVNVTAGDARNRWLWIIEGPEGFLDSFLQFRQMQQAR